MTDDKFARPSTVNLTYLLKEEKIVKFMLGHKFENEAPKVTSKSDIESIKLVDNPKVALRLIYYDAILGYYLMIYISDAIDFFLMYPWLWHPNIK